ncbi:UNVERIFIED_CONTAM: hypothetical protein HDU68_002312 [Siphonaria sp. JEL0065]|nr:hypothetical protein HDU68_002312 [Siphonaria sp. JEL0065]
MENNNENATFLASFLRSFSTNSTKSGTVSASASTSSLRQTDLVAFSAKLNRKTFEFDLKRAFDSRFGSLSSESPDKVAYADDVYYGKYSLDPAQFHVFNTLDPVGLVIVSVDRAKATGYVRSKLGFFQLKLEMHDQSDNYKISSFQTATSTADSFRPTEHDLLHWRSIFDAYFALARYSDELSGDQLSALLAQFSKCFEYQPQQHIIVDIYDTTASDGVPSSLDTTMLGTSVEQYIGFEKHGPALCDLGLTPKRPGSDEFRPPVRSSEDKVEKRAGLFEEIRDNEVNYNRNLSMMALIRDSFHKRATQDPNFCMDSFLVARCFMEVDNFQQISTTFINQLKDQYFSELPEKRNPKVYIKLLLEYISAFDPLIIAAASQVTYSQKMLDKVIALPDFQKQLETAATTIRNTHKTEVDLITLRNLPFSRLQYLRNGITSILESTPLTHPTSNLFHTAALQIHILSRKIESKLDQLESESFMIQLGTALECSEIISAHRVYLNDWAIEASKLNWETSGGVGGAIMLLSDMVLVLARFQERSGSKSVYRVQRYICMDDLLDVERDGCEVAFLFKYSRDSFSNTEKIETVLRFICDSEIKSQTMCREIKHAWISHCWGHAYTADTAASFKKLPMYVTERDEVTVYYRILKGVDSVQKAEFKQPLYANIGIVYGIDEDVMGEVGEKVCDGYAVFGAFSNPSVRTDVVIRIRPPSDVFWNRGNLTTLSNVSDANCPGTIQSIQGEEKMANLLFKTAAIVLQELETPTSQLSLQKRNIHLLNVFSSWPKISILRKASFACKQLLSGRGGRSRRQSSASMFSLDAGDRSSIHDGGEDSRSIHTLDSVQGIFAGGGGGSGGGSVETSPEKMSRKVLQLSGGGLLRHVRSQSMASADYSSGGGSNGNGNSSASGSIASPRGIGGLQSRSRMWFQKSATSFRTPTKKKVIEFGKLGDLALVQALCAEIELKEEKRAYNNAAVAAAAFPEQVLCSRKETIALASRSKSASGFVLALRILLNSEVGDTTFSERFLLSSYIQQLMLGTTSSIPEMAGFLAASLFKNEAGKNSPFETRFLCLSLISLLIEHYQYIVNGVEDFLDIDEEDHVSISCSPTKSLKSMPSNESLQSSNYQTPAFFTPIDGSSADDLVGLAVDSEQGEEVVLEACVVEDVEGIEALVDVYTLHVAIALEEKEEKQKKKESDYEEVVECESTAADGSKKGESIIGETHSEDINANEIELVPLPADALCTNEFQVKWESVGDAFVADKLAEGEMDIEFSRVSELVQEVVDRVMRELSQQDALTSLVEGIEEGRGEGVKIRPALAEVSLNSTETLLVDSNWRE